MLKGALRTFVLFFGGIGTGVLQTFGFLSDFALGSLSVIIVIGSEFGWRAHFVTALCVEDFDEI